MKAKVIKNTHAEWEFKEFPTFGKGTKVTLADQSDEHFLHWFPCEIERHETFVPESFVSNGALTREYNPTELVQIAGDILEVREIVNAWLIATNEKGVTGWIPAEVVISVI